MRSPCWHAPSSSFPPTTRRRTCCRSRARSWRSTPGSTCWWSTTPARTAPEIWSSASAPASPGSRSCGAPESSVSAPPTWRASAGDSTTATDASSPWTAMGATIPATSRPCSRLLENFDMVIGSRYVPGGGIVNWPRHRRALSAFANFYARVLLRLPAHDCTSGFRVYSREVLETVDPFAIRSSGYSFLEEMAWRVARCGFRIGEVPIVFEQRTLGISKIDSSEIYLAAWRVLALALPPAADPSQARFLSQDPCPASQRAARPRTMSWVGAQGCAWSRAWVTSSNSISPFSRTSSFCTCMRRCGRRSRAGNSPRSASRSATAAPSRARVRNTATRRTRPRPGPAAASDPVGSRSRSRAAPRSRAS